MAEYYLDRSALAKRYVAEPGSDWVRSLVSASRRNVILTARITGAEVVAALALRARVGTLAPSHVRSAMLRFRRDFRTSYQLIEITEPVIDSAMTLAETHALRGYDAVQLACALLVQSVRATAGPSAVIFVSADGPLLAAATAENLPVEDPNAHQ